VFTVHAAAAHKSADFASVDFDSETSCRSCKRESFTRKLKNFVFHFICLLINSEHGPHNNINSSQSSIRVSMADEEEDPLAATREWQSAPHVVSEINTFLVTAPASEVNPIVKNTRKFLNTAVV
jgi:hypothetical protein